MDMMEIFVKCQKCGNENVLFIRKGDPEISNCSNCGKLIISYTPVNGYVYILSNSKMPNLLKIGFTRRSYEDRLAELNAETGVPAPFIPEVIFYSENPSEHEKILHERLSAYRVEQKEFFEIDTDKALSISIEVCGRQPFYMSDELKRIRDKKLEEQRKKEELEKGRLIKEKLKKEDFIMKPIRRSKKISNIDPDALSKWQEKMYNKK